MTDRPRYAHNSTLKAPTKPMNKVNYERRARREEADLVMGTHHKAIMTFPCALAAHPDHACASYVGRQPIEGHHLKTVKTGGQDRNNQLPVCNRAHDELHGDGSISASCERLGWDLRSLACEYTKQIDAMHPGEQSEES